MTLLETDESSLARLKGFVAMVKILREYGFPSRAEGRRVESPEVTMNADAPERRALLNKSGRVARTNRLIAITFIFDRSELRPAIG
mmetsp:Transcript_41934/g.127153  ORF Transcript_41934/g.127153 Transcript_41934/m.127153 type:complete len:86 (-) Transcript_41934:6-263(-)